MHLDHPVLEPGGLSRLIETYLEKGGVISVSPYHRMASPYEQLSAFFNLISMAGTGSFTLLGSLLKPKGAFGPCMLCSRQDYLAVGGQQTASFMAQVSSDPQFRGQAITSTVNAIPKPISRLRFNSKYDENTSGLITPTSSPPNAPPAAMAK